MYKLLSAILAIALLVLGGFYAYTKYENGKQIVNLNNTIAKQEQTVKESKDEYSKMAVQEGSLKAENDALQKTIKSRDEKILSLTQINLQLKNQTLKISDAKQTVVKQGSTERVSVSFEKSTNLVDVSGFTLTNPPEAEVNLNFKPLNLQLDLAKDDNGTFRVYLDDKNDDFSNINLNLTVDPSVMNRKWYELIGVNGGVMLGNSILVSNVGIQVKLWKLLVGPSLGVVVGPSVEKVWGVQFSYFPFQRNN